MSDNECPGCGAGKADPLYVFYECGVGQADAAFISSKPTIKCLTRQRASLQAIVDKLIQAGRQAYILGYERCTCGRSWPRAGHHHKDCMAHLQEAFRTAEAARANADD